MTEKSSFVGIRAFRATLFVVLAAFPAVEVPGQTTRTWNGTVSVAWGTAANWTPAGVPLATEDVIVPAGTPNSPSTAGAVAVCRDLTVDANALLNIVPGSDVGVGRGVTVNGSARAGGAVRPGGPTPGGGISGSGIIQNVIVEKTGGADFFVAGNVTVSGAFTLNSGVLKIGVGSALLLVQGNAAFNGGSVTAGLTTGSIDVRGNTVFAGAAFTGAIPLFCGGNLTVGSGFAPGSGSITFNGAGTQSVTATVPLPAAPFNNLVVSTGATVTTASILQVAGTVTLDGALGLTGGAAMSTAGTFLVSATGSLGLGNATHVFGAGLGFSGTALTATGTFQFTGAGTVASTLPFPNVVFSAGAITVNGPLTITNNMTVSGATVTLQNGDLTVNGTVSVTGGCFTTAGSAALAASGPLIPGSSCGPVNYRVLGNWTSGPSFQPTSGITIFAGTGSQFVDAAGSVFSNVQIDGTSNSEMQSNLHTGNQTTINGSLLMHGNEFQADGDVILGPNGVLDLGSLDGGVDHHFKGNFTATSSGAQAGTIIGNGFMVFDGQGQQTVSSAATLTNLKVAGSAAGATVRTTGTVNVAGDLDHVSGSLSVEGTMLVVGGDATMQGGNLDNSGSTLDIRGDASFSGTIATTPPEIRFGGDWSSDASFAPTARTVRFDGAGPQSITLAAGGFSSVTIAAGAQVIANTDLDIRGALSVTGSLQAGAGRSVDVDGQAVIATGGSLNIGAMDSTFASDFACTGTVTGTGTLVFDGHSINVSSSSAVPPIRVDGTLFRTVGSGMTTAAFSLLNGDVDGSFHALGNAVFSGGSLISGVVDVDGDVTFAGPLSSTFSTIFCAGNWASDPNFHPPSGLGAVFMDGSTPQTIMNGGSFSSLQIRPGSLVTAASPIVISSGGGGLDVRGSLTFPAGTLLDANGPVGILAGATLDLGPEDSTLGGDFSNQGSLTGTGTMIFDGSSVINSFMPAPTPLLAVRVTGTLFQPSGNGVLVNGDFTLEAGVSTLSGGLHVTGNADFQGGTLDFGSTLDVDGHITFGSGVAVTGTPTIFCAGNWSAAPSFNPASGTIRLDGAGTTTLSVIPPATAMNFANLFVQNGIRVVGNDFTLNATSVTVQNGGTFRVPVARTLTVPSGAVTVNGTLDVDAGGQLALGPSAAVDIANNIFTSGTLELVGSAASPAVVTGTGGGGYAFTVQGTLRAGNFRFERMGAAGIVLGPSLSFAPAPDDFRGGTFSFPAAAAGSRLLDLSLQQPATFRYLEFLDPLNQGTFNVRQNGAPVTMVNWSGAFGGAAFENDLSNNLTWAPPQITAVTFQAIAGPGNVTLGWTTTSEIDVAHFLVDRATNPAGPFAQIVQVAAAGPATYQVVDSSLSPGVTRFYRLRERLTHGAEITLASAAATPLPVASAASVLTVGPGGAYPTIQAAINAATSPVTTILVEPGAYPTFTVAGGVPGTMRIIGGRFGAVAVSTTSGPVQLLNLPPGHNVEISDLTIGSAATAGPGLLVSGCQGVVVLDESAVAAGPGNAGVGVLGSGAVAIQRTSISGAPGLLLDLGSVAVASKGSLDSVTVQGSSSLRTVELNPAATVQPGSTLTSFAGVMPDLFYPDFLPFGVPFSGTITAGPGTPWFLLVSPNVVWNDFAPFIEMVALVDLTNFIQLGEGVTDAFGNAQTLTLELPTSATAINGVPFALQILVYDPVSGMFRIGNLASTQGLM